MMVESGSVRAVLLDDADLVEWGEKMERSMPAAKSTSFVQRLKVFRETLLIGGTVVKKKPVIEPRKTDVLSRFKEESGNLWRKALVFKRSPDNSMAVNFCARGCIRYGSCGSISELRGRMNGVSASK
ncbi:hypothetical protein E2C01_075480 [Portunus trituberculatus]|uniref:Uncharacterized protein n=1 Tax=Portunus trituberculatus TaxID=210409 RepID=A0A5B7IK93_PORTR|nr:hypothetical protein [Portunus trituberculatus]